MPASLLSTLRSAVLHVSPNYELLQLDQLTGDQQDSLNDLRARPNVFGVLRPRKESFGNLKAVSHNAAALYSALARPMRLADAIRDAIDDNEAQEIAKLVLDGVLEIESKRSGGFVSGADAFSLLCSASVDATPPSVTARLSRSALRYAQALELYDPAQLSLRMYLYNRQPADFRWRRILSSVEAVIVYLGLEPGGAVDRLIKSIWRPVSRANENDAWLAWYLPRRVPAGDRDAATYKLYLSAPCEHMPQAFSAALCVLAKHRVGCFKVGATLHGLLRPDKMVIYFDSFADMQVVGTALRKALAAIPAQGVPFTAAFDDDGLVCWGMDPPRCAQWLSWQPRESWRLWVTNRLASYMSTARISTAQSLEPWQFALERLRLDGIDVDTWTPRNTIWDSDAEEQE